MTILVSLTHLKANVQCLYFPICQNKKHIFLRGYVCVGVYFTHITYTFLFTAKMTFLSYFSLLLTFLPTNHHHSDCIHNETLCNGYEMHFSKAFLYVFCNSDKFLFTEIPPPHFYSRESKKRNKRG